MKRSLTIYASAALACGVVLASLSGMTAVAANAGQNAPIMTVIEQTKVDINGVDHGWYSHSAQKADVILTPQLAVLEIASSAVGDRRKPAVTVTHLVISNGSSYTKSRRAVQYTQTTLTAAALASATDEFNPYFIEAKFDAIGGIKLVGTRQYRAVGSGARVRAFLEVALGLTAGELNHYGIGETTINFSLNAAGQPINIVVAGQSSTDPMTASETFASYNQPLTIYPPST
jgi:hypothetical protein